MSRKPCKKKAAYWEALRTNEIANTWKQIEKYVTTARKNNTVTQALRGPDIPYIAIETKGPLRNEEFQR